MIGAYGQDDRVCSFAALQGLFDAEETLKRTGVCMLADKEEIGSEGVSGMQSCGVRHLHARTCATPAGASLRELL